MQLKIAEFTLPTGSRVWLYADADLADILEMA